jgi:hypothetical protein
MELGNSRSAFEVKQALHVDILRTEHGIYDGCRRTIVPGKCISSNLCGRRRYPCNRAVVFEQLARREREHRVMGRREGENDGEALRWGSSKAQGEGGDALRQWLMHCTQLPSKV